MKYIYKSILIGLIITNMFFACGKKYYENQSEEHWNTVYSAVENDRLTFNKLNTELKEIYSNISTDNVDKNLEKLQKVKILAAEVKILTDGSLEILKNKIQEGDTIEIYAVGLKYLNAIKAMEPLMPELYKKVESDIKGNETQKSETILKAANNIIEIGFEYKSFMDSYYDEHLIEKKNGS